MNKKLLSILAILLALTCIFAVSVFAANDEPFNVYVKGDAGGTGASEDSPATYISAALNLVPAGTKSVNVVVVDSWTVSGNPTLSDYNFDITFVGNTEDSYFGFDSNFYFSADDDGNTVTFDLPVKVADDKSYAIVGGYNNFVFTENFKTLDGGKFSFYGGSVGYKYTKKETYTPAEVTNHAICETAYTIDVYGGDFYAFGGGNYRPAIDYLVGSIAAPVTVNIYGGTFGDPNETYNIATNNKSFEAFSISGMSTLADDATLNIEGGTFYCPIYAQGRTDTVIAGASEAGYKAASDPKYYAIDGDIEINITGGTFNGGEVSAYYTHAAYTTLVRGNFDVNITGGTFKEGTVIDATQVKAYEGKDEKATLTYTVENVTDKRFDVVNGEAKTYEEPIRVVFIGDSITEGYAPAGANVVRLTESYSAQFLAKCEEEGKEVIVGNFGVSSAGFHPVTTRYYMDMLAYPMVIKETDPNYVFFAMGTNDAQTIGGTHGALLEFANNYRTIAKEFGDRDEVEMVYITSALYRNHLDSKGKLTAAGIRMPAVLHNFQIDLADELGEKYAFVDLYGLTLDMVKDNYKLFAYEGDADGDQLHPSRDGLKAIGVHCYNALFNETYAPENEYKKTDIYISANGKLFGAGTEEEPISNPAYAFGIMAHGKEVTLHVMGEFDIGSSNIPLPAGPSKLNIVGYENGASIKFTGNTFKCSTDTKFDNVKLVGGTSEVMLFAFYNNVEFTDTVTTEGKWSFYAGYNIFSDVDAKTSATTDDAVSASSSNDCVITLNGGNFNNVMFGNKLCANNAPFGTYSGDMTVTVGEKVTFNGDGTYFGLVGHNYSTGSINATINAWKGDVTEFGPADTKYTSTEPYNFINNVGKTSVSVGDKVTGKVCYVGDFDGDGKLGLDDALEAIGYVFTGVPADKAAAYLGKTEITLADIFFLFKKV